LVPGAFVRVKFPTGEKPRQPGLRHRAPRGTAIQVMLAYTTSQPWPATVPLSAGARRFDREEAARLNQSRAFMLRLDGLAKLPVTEAWFPDLALPGQGVIAVAPAGLREEPTDLAMNLVRRRRSLIQMRGV
jgi:hypothetical protein